jgi:hypothetical protein
VSRLPLSAGELRKIPRELAVLREVLSETMEA